MSFEKYENCITGLIKSSILKEDTFETDNSVDMNILKNIIISHNIVNIVFPLLDSKGLASGVLSKKFNAAIYIDTNQQYYLEILKKRFEEEKIRFVCMKGAYLKTLYPESYMRSSSDIDIFVDDENTDKVHDIMTELGFKTDRFSHQMQDDSYTKDNIVHIEIHRKLISNKCPWDAKCQDIVNRIVPVCKGSYEYRMTDEDFYLHMIGHMAKHMKYSGFGIRMLIDVWVYLNAFQNKMDRKLLDERLSACGLDKFEKEIGKLVDYWFNGKAADKETKELSRYVFESGIFGNKKQFKATELVNNQGKTQSKRLGILVKLVKGFFLPYENMCLLYPTLSKYRILLPFYRIYRAFNIIIFKNKKIIEASKEYDDMDMNYADRVVKLKKRLGL